MDAPMTILQRVEIVRQDILTLTFLSLGCARTRINDHLLWFREAVDPSFSTDSAIVALNFACHRLLDAVVKHGLDDAPGVSAARGQALAAANRLEYVLLTRPQPVRGRRLDDAAG